MNPRTNHVVSYRDVLEQADSESIETTVRRRRLLWAGSVVRSDAKRLNRRVVFGELERSPPAGGEEYQIVPRGQEKQWTGCVEGDLNAFGITGDWKNTANKTGIWCRTVVERGR